MPGFLQARLSLVKRILRIDRPVLYLAPNRTVALVSLLLHPINLLRTFLERVSDLCRDFSRHPIDQLALGLPNEHLSDLMVLYMIGRIVVQLFEHPIINKDGAIRLVSGILGLFALLDALNRVVKVLDRPVALILLS